MQENQLDKSTPDLTSNEKPQPAPESLPDTPTPRTRPLPPVRPSSRKIWTTEEIERTIYLRDVEHLSWLRISDQLEGRTARAVYEKYYRVKNSNGRRQSDDFTPEEEELLDELQGRGLTWDELAEEFLKKFPLRTLEELRLHSFRYLGGPRAGIRYSNAENEQLVDLKENQQLSWEEIAEVMWWRPKESLVDHYHVTLNATSPRRRIWSDEDIEKLRILKGQGLSLEVIGQKLNRSAFAVKQKLKKSSMCTRNWSYEDKERLRVLEAQGLSAEKIAPMLNRSVDAVIAQLKRFRKDSPYRTWNDEEKEELRILSEQGLPVEEIAQRLDRSVRSVNRKLNQLGKNVTETHEDRR